MLSVIEKPAGGRRRYWGGTNVSEASKLVDSYEPGTLEWMAVDPGRQMIGSFHPITSRGWDIGVYHGTEQDLVAKVKAKLEGSTTRWVKPMARPVGTPAPPVVDPTYPLQKTRSGRRAINNGNNNNGDDSGESIAAEMGIDISLLERTAFTGSLTKTISGRGWYKRTVTVGTCNPSHPFQTANNKQKETLLSQRPISYE